VLGARVLAEFGDDATRYIDARARKNYAGTSPITRQSGKKKHVLARYVHNDRLIDALNRQAFAALRASPGARAYYDRLRARGVGHHAALRQLGNRLVGILHGCLKTDRSFDEDTAWHATNKIYKLLPVDNKAHGMSSGLSLARLWFNQSKRRTSCRRTAPDTGLPRQRSSMR